MQSTVDDSERTIRYRDMTPLSSSLVGQRVTHNPQRNRFMETVRRFNITSALEIGCNVGAVIGRVHDELGIRCAGFDFNAPSIEYAADKYPDIDFRVLDAEHMLSAYNPQQFDLIFSVGTLMHCGPNLFKRVCSNILALRPKVIIHHEPQGEEALIRELPLGRIWKASKYAKSPMPDTPDDRIIYFQRRHDYAAFYYNAGISASSIVYDPDLPELSQCSEVVVILDDFCIR